MTMDTGRRLYHHVAARTSRTVLQDYSTSFALGTRLLDSVTRRGIEAVYGMVRVADEIVDTYRGPGALEVLDAMHRETMTAIERGWSGDLIVHSFARVARYVGIGEREIEPFFASMRTDLDRHIHDRDSFDQYVHGSAEVIGLMCLAVFLNADRAPHHAPRQPSELASKGAQALGAAFQKINFLRDLGADHGILGRSYFPQMSGADFDENMMQEIVAEIDSDLRCARASLVTLPRRARCAVAATLAIYTALLDRLAASTPQAILTHRIRLSPPVKLRVAATAAARAAAMGEAS